jgi:hypothetical protein
MWRRSITKLMANILARAFLAANGLFFVDEVEVDYCYKKFMGPDWKASYEKVGTRISNHSCFHDIAIHTIH